ncbi:MAG: hypothetical protein R3Y43_06775 [Alphaproteobacteria bacterium]
MVRKSIKPTEYKKLFALSGNVCAFPGCDHPIVNNNNELVAQICHIEAASEKGERYNPNMTDDERASIDNLMLMCYRHHIETNDCIKYPVEKLKKIKKEHEDLYKENPYIVKSKVLFKILDEENSFWKDLDTINTSHINQSDLAFKINTELDLIDLCKYLEDDLNLINSIIADMYNDFELLPNRLLSFLKDNNIDTTKLEEISYYENPFELMHWETFNIYYANVIKNVKILILQIKLRYLMKLSIKTAEEANLISEIKTALKDLAKNEGYAD